MNWRYAGDVTIVCARLDFIKIEIIKSLWIFLVVITCLSTFLYFPVTLPSITFSYLPWKWIMLPSYFGRFWCKRIKPSLSLQMRRLWSSLEPVRNGAFTAWIISLSLASSGKSYTYPRLIHIPGSWLDMLQTLLDFAWMWSA